jgi:post-segregation antitoxin (ccd killing protein)
MKKTIDLADDLGERLEADASLDVSAVCEAALEAELQRRKALAELGASYKRVTGFVEKIYRSGGAPAGGEDMHSDVEFDGKYITSDDDGTVHVYLTPEHRIAVYVDDTREQALYIFENFEDFQESTQFPPGVITAVGNEIGEKARPTYLGI